MCTANARAHSSTNRSPGDGGSSPSMLRRPSPRTASPTPTIW